MASNSDICEFNNVSKWLGNLQIINNLSFSLEKGKVTALLGPNGAGKTTTLRILLGLLKPSTGNVRVFGKDIKNDPEIVRAKIGLLPQSDSGYKGLTGKQNIEFVLNLSGKSRREYEQELDYLIERLDLNEEMNKDWAVLSGGEQRALGFIRAILVGDDFIILDEPTSGLDLARAAMIRKIIQEQVEILGKTVLMSSHIITDLEQLAENIIIIKNGKILKIGSKDEIINHFAKDGNFEAAIVASFSEKRGSK